jgi:hypothetical protein
MLLRAIIWARLAALVAASALMLQSCSTAGYGTPPPSLDISGDWAGHSFPGCRSSGGVNCYKRPIAFELEQNGSSVVGSYSCPIGNMMCGTDNSGKVIDGRMTGASLSGLRVVFSDVTNCLYQGQFTDSGGEGAYMCFAGAGRIVEQGGWHLDRSGK